MFADTIIVLAGSVMKAQLAWDISDTFNGLMMLPNLIGVVTLSPIVMRCTKNYVARNLHGKEIEPMLSMFPDIQKVQEEALREELREEALYTMDTDKNIVNLCFGWQQGAEIPPAVLHTRTFCLPIL